MILPQDITASAGVAVTQTVSGLVVTGTLKTALTGADTKSIVVTATTESDSFISSENIVIATPLFKTANSDITTDADRVKNIGTGKSGPIPK